jgi:hypothetical protein
MAKKIRLEVDQQYVETVLNDKLYSSIRMAVSDFFQSPAFTQKVHDAVNAELDNFAFQQRLIYDVRFQQDMEKMIRKMLCSNTAQIEQKVELDGILKVLQKYDPDVLLRLIHQIKSEQSLQAEREVGDAGNN